MQTDSQHIIHKLTLEVTTSSVEQGYELKDNMRSFFDTHIVPAIEHYFAGLTVSMGADEVIQLDKLELTVSGGQNGWSTSDLGQAIQVEFTKAISVTQSELNTSSVSGKTGINYVSDPPKVENAKVFTKSEYGVSAWISFLNDGITSWFAEEMLKSGSSNLEDQLLKSLLQEVERVHKNRSLIFDVKQTRERLVQQFSDDFLISLVTLASKGGVSVNYSSVFPEQDKPITLLIHELLRGVDSITRIRFWESVFGMVKLDTSQPVLSEAAFLAQLERLFPKAINLLKSGKSKSVEKNKNVAKSTGIGNDQIPNASATRSSLILDDVSIIGIRLLEWTNVLQSKSVSLKTYSALQASVLENKRVSSASNTSQNTSPSGLVKPPQKDTIQASKSGGLSITKGLDSENNTDSTVEKTEKQTGDIELDLKNQRAKTNDETELPAVAKEQSKLREEKSAASSDSEEIMDLESIGNDKDQIQDPVIQSEPVTDSVSELNKETASPANPITLPGTNKPANSDKAKDNPPPKKKLFKDEQAHLLVENAGLVILHPFLKHFFKGIGLLNEENKLTDKVLAAHVLHYVATGREHDFEQLMSFAKYLVGIDPYESIPREVVISDAIKLETENLMKAVRENWKPLQSSSTAALRETFIQRTGKLINESPNPRLVVERKTVDVLLGQLNWTISIIRLPWLDEIIFVEW